MNVTGEVEPRRGVRFFVVGTGGAQLHPAIFDVRGREIREADSWGILKLTLHETDDDWDYLPAGTSQFHDAGHGSCVAPGR